MSFFRGIGGTLGTSVPGAVLAQRLAEETAAAADSSPATAPDRKADDLVEARDLVQAGSGE
ncbi:hypothetical protein KBZ21_30410 [Streptomyces sp. A73]|nr:hypothetical protein [Streptomyces sp. A73]